jgi:glutaminyl-tRNA synthetase
MSENVALNFVDRLVYEDKENRNIDKVVTRFPPEPNGYLHIGSAYAINISYGIAKKYGGQFNLRFDDTNPMKEDMEYVHAIIEDMAWLGCDYGKEPFFGSDYSKQIFDYAVFLIRQGKAYVCDLTMEEMRTYRGTLTESGKNSPYRDRSPEENLKLFEDMRLGLVDEGVRVLRAKIDMESPNLILRDPVIYRVLKEKHYRTGSEWCIYPMYDFAHPIQDYIEGVTHSLCSNEFINHRPLYDWVLDALDLKGVLPRQIEFGRLNLTGVVTSKRYLKQLVDSGILDGWDDPRLPTIKGLRRRGVTKEAIFDFVNEIGVPKTSTTVDYKMLEHFVRQDLKEKVMCLMMVQSPLKVVITNLEETEYVDVDNHFSNPEFGSRKLPFTKELYIEREDFCEQPSKKFKRLSPGEEVRLRSAYFIKCNEVIKDDQGEVIELRCTYDPATKSGSGFNERKPKGTIHWLSASDAIKCTVRLYEDLFLEEPSDDQLVESINMNSKKVYEDALVEGSILKFIDQGEKRFQFIRNGYYVVDKELTTKELLVMNQIVSLKSNF